LTQAGIPQPKFSYVNSYEGAKEFLIEIDGKGVIKATDNSASRGFARFDSVEDFKQEHFDTAIKEGSTGYVMMEEALNPRTDCISEQSVETLWYQGEMIWLNWVDRLFKTDLKFFPTVMLDDNVNWGVEVGHINPAVHSEALRGEVEQLIYKAGIALGMDKEPGGHILKADIMLTINGPVILEMTPRLSGGWDSSASTLARGANFQAGALQMALGAEVNSSFINEYFKYKKPQIFASVIAEVETGAINCLGRKFSIGLETNREQSLAISKTNLQKEIYVI
jgi:biotin carboxylase